MEQSPWSQKLSVDALYGCTWEGVNRNKTNKKVGERIQTKDSEKVQSIAKKIKEVAGIYKKKYSTCPNNDNGNCVSDGPEIKRP